MRLFETPAMLAGNASMSWCQNCGAIIYVPDGIEVKRQLVAGCPVCAKDMWVRLSRGQGPFEWGAE